MNLRAKCVNTNCDAFDKVKSVGVGTLTGFGASNQRVKCPLCGELMQTTKSIAVKPRGGTVDAEDS
jgi:ribosomal protein S27E